MQTAIFFVTDVRHAFVTVYILLESENSRKSSGKPYFTAGLGVRIQPRTLWWISILFRTPWQPHTVSNEQLMALFEKPATVKRFVDTCYSSLFCKRTHRHVRKSRVLPGISWSKAISDKLSGAQR